MIPQPADNKAVQDGRLDEDKASSQCLLLLSPLPRRDKSSVSADDLQESFTSPHSSPHLPRRRYLPPSHRQTRQLHSTHAVFFVLHQLHSTSPPRPSQNSYKVTECTDPEVSISPNLQTKLVRCHDMAHLYGTPALTEAMHTIPVLERNITQRGNPKSTIDGQYSRRSNSIVIFFIMSDRCELFKEIHVCKVLRPIRTRRIHLLSTLPSS